MDKNKIVEEVENTYPGLKISRQALNVISKIDKFPIEHFLKWYHDHKLGINGGNVFEYVDVVMKE